jgi:transposase
MGGSDTRSGELFSYIDLEQRVPAKHPLRKIRQLVSDVLVSLDGEFAKLYSAFGRESIPPERLLRALLLQALFTIRSERQLMEQLDYNLMFRWFVGLGIDDPVWVPTVFTKNRDRLLDADVAAKFMEQLLAHKEVRKLLSDRHFSVDGTLIEAWASMKSFQPKPEPTAGKPPDKTGGDPLAPPTAETKPTPADGHAERRAALAMINRRCPGEKRITVGADKGYDSADFVADLRAINVTPHVAVKLKGAALDGRTTRHAAYAVSQRIRKRIEEAFGWGKTVGTAAKTMLRSTARVGFQFTLNMAAYNLARLPRLLAA